MVAVQASRIDEAAHIVEMSLRRGAIGRPLLWAAVSLVGGGALVAAILGAAGASSAVTAPVLFAAVVAALGAAWWDERQRASRWEAWTRLIRDNAVPALRAAVLEATPDEALLLGRRVASLVARSGPLLPEPPGSLREAELRFLDGLGELDPKARVLAWLAAEVCGGARDGDRLVRCPFLMALKRAAADRVIADG